MVKFNAKRYLLVDLIQDIQFAQIMCKYLLDFEGLIFWIERIWLIDQKL